MQPIASASTSTPRVIFSTLPSGSSGSTAPAPTGSPQMSSILTHLNSHVNTLSDAPQDDVKFHALKEISENIEELYGTSSYIPLVENLIRVFIKILHETTPQFIAENNTLQLRKLILELLYRLSSSEIMKSYSKNLQQILLRLIHIENEENALLIIKILTDHIKTFRPPFSVELTAFLIQWKNAFNEMFQHTANEAMFLQRPFITTNKTIEESVVEALKTCYFTTALSYSQQQTMENVSPSLEKYTLIPKASQSVKVLAEMSVFILVLIQAHRQHLLSEILDIVPIFVRYINVAIPLHVREDKLYHRELVDEFHNSQVRALTFIAYTAKHSQMAEIMNANSKALTEGILLLFDSFHDDVINQRRELLLAVKYFFQSDFRANFISVIPKMCNEKVLLGNSFTSQDQLRNQAYSWLADILHHVRMHLRELLMPMFFLCTRNLHDQQLLPYVQTMYGKLMMNLIEPLMVQAKENAQQQNILNLQRQIICNAIDSFVRKARMISDFHLPHIFEKYRMSIQQQQSTNLIITSSSSQSANEQQNTVSNTMQQKANINIEIGPVDTQKLTTNKTSIAIDASQEYWQDPISPLSLNDCKNMVRFIIQPTKILVIALNEIGIPPKEYRRVETLLSEFFLYGLKCLDVFMIGLNTSLQHQGSNYLHKSNPSTSVRSKEEKETMEAFIAIYTNIESTIFEKILELNIELLIDRINLNPVLQNICTILFAHLQTMRKTGLVLVKYLLTKLPELGVSNGKAALYLKLFKLVFQTLSSPTNNSDCETILKPFLHQIVQEAMRLAISSRESTNYFLLLRSLFRSIGSGTHDNLYQQFLPLLPSILQKLNRLQNGSHRQPIHELFVELCLTVPVRLSSLLPYLPLLMDPLVCALNGSQTLVQQGLRTLELCVDNLQPEYLYDNMQPVRSALMKGLWRTVYCGDFQSALVALRILGKFGGSNRKILMDAQTMDYQIENDLRSPKLLFTFLRELESDKHEITQIRHITLDDQPELTCVISIDNLIQNAIGILRSQSNDLGSQSTVSKIEAANFIKIILLSIIGNNSFNTQKITSLARKLDIEKTKFSNYFCRHQISRRSFIAALNGLFIAVFNTETRTQMLPFFKALIKYLTIQTILESNKDLFNYGDCSYLDSIVLIDTIVQTLSDSCKDYCHTAIVALRLLIDIAATFFDNDREKASRLPIFSYMLEKVTALCYRREWFARLGGCTAMRLIIEYYPQNFIKENAVKFFDGCIEIISGLSDELSSGALDFASKTIDQFLKILFKDVQPNSDILLIFVSKIIDYIDDPEPMLRKECFRIVNSIGEKLALDPAKVLLPSRDKLLSKIFNGMQHFHTLSIHSKIALMEIYIFCAKVNEIYDCISYKTIINFAQNLLNMVCADDNTLKTMLKLTPNKNGITVNANNQRDVDIKIRNFRGVSTAVLIHLYFHISYKSDGNDDILYLIFKSLVDYTLEHVEDESHDLNRGVATNGIVEILELEDAHNVNHHLYIDQKLDDIIRDFRSKKQFISSLLFKKLHFLTKYSSRQISVDDIQQLTMDLSLIMQTSASSLNNADIKCVISALDFFTISNYYGNYQLVEKLFMFFSEDLIGSPTKMKNEWHNSIFEFFFKCPTMTKIILSKSTFSNENSTKFIQTLINSCEATRLRKELLQQSNQIKILVDEITSNLEIGSNYELNLLKFISSLLENEDGYQENIVMPIFSSIRSLWVSKRFEEQHSTYGILCNKTLSSGDESKIDKTTMNIMDESKFDTPVYCAKIILARIRYLLHEVDHIDAEDITTTDIYAKECIDLLYELTFAFSYKFSSDFTFLRKFIDEEIIQKLPLSWRRLAFFKVITLLKEDPANGHSIYLVRFAQYIMAPLFAYAFEVYDTDLVVGGPPPSEFDQQEEQNNIVSVLCKEVIQRLTNDRTIMGNSLTIIMYLFCSMLVQKCPMHIYDPSKKQQQGNRQEQGNLRHFMLFGWPCLQQSFQGDMTEKYAGHFLIANIIDKFSINRTIILQVLHSLMQAHHQDNRDMIKKSLDILIPAMPRRMMDGYTQLQVLFKKTMVEECRNSSQIVHCLQVIIRHYKVVYHIRHQITHLILSSLQRLFSMQMGLETKRLILEICDVVIKWEYERQTALSCDGDGEATITDLNRSVTPIATVSADIQIQQQAAPDLHKQMDKHFLDNIVIFLFRIATSTDQISGSILMGTSAMEQINRKALLLLRNALKPNIYGSIVTVRTHLFEKQLQLPSPEQFSSNNEAAINQQLQMVNATLDVLSNLIHHLDPQVILDIFRPLQRSLICCMSYSNSQQILRTTYNILSKLLEKTKSSPNGLDEFEYLNQHITRCIHESFNNYAGTLTSSPPMTMITLLRLMHSSQPAYLETICLNSFIKLLQRLVREYVVVPQSSSTGSIIDQAQKLNGDLLSICLEVLYSRTRHFHEDAQRTIVQYVLLPLVEKNAIDKILENIIKIATEIMISELAQYKSILEKSTPEPTPCQSQGVHVLIKLFISMEQRLSKNADLKRQYLTAILIAYENKDLLDANFDKIQSAFYWGLCFNERSIRDRYFTIFEKRFPSLLASRIIYIMSKENWTIMSGYFWISHIIHLLLLTANVTDQKIQMKDSAIFANILQSVQMNENESDDMKEGGEEKETTEPFEEERIEMEIDKITEEIRRENEILGEKNVLVEEEQKIPVETEPKETTFISMRLSLNEAINSGNESFDEFGKKTSFEKNIAEIKKNLFTQPEIGLNTILIKNIMGILHSDHELCHKIFIEIFISLWDKLEQNERDKISELIPIFLISIGNDLHQSNHSPAATFLETFIRCNPPIKIDPFILSYIGSNHRCWHMAILKLEQLAKGIKFSGESLSNAASVPEEKLEILDSLSLLYQKINEFDQYTSIWKQKAYFDKTIKCFTFYQQGDYYRARDCAEKIMANFNERISKTASSEQSYSIFSSSAIQGEILEIERSWINSCKQLNDWNSLEIYAGSEEVADPMLLADAFWHLDEWKVLRESLIQVDAAANPQHSIKSTMLKLMMNIANFEQPEHRLHSKEFTEKSLLDINKALVMIWRKQLPPIISHSHIEMLFNIHFNHEISESARILQSNQQSFNFPSSNNGSNGLNYDVKQLMKSWRSRSMTNVDQLNYWHDLFHWRFQFFNGILRFYENTDQKSSFSLPLHAIAQTQLQFARALRHANQTELALNELNKLHSAILVHPIDVQCKLVEHIKCLMKLSPGDSTYGARKMAPQDGLLEALDMIESTQIQFFKKDQVARLMVCKGILLNRLDKREEAGRAFSAAAQLEHVEVPGPSSVWKHWGDFLTNIFLANHNETSALSTGIQAIACNLEQVKMVTPLKARASVAKLFWLIKVASSSSSSSEKITNAIDEIFAKYIENVPPANWIFWLNSIVADVRRRNSRSMSEILKNLTNYYPQQVLCELRIELGPLKVTEIIQQFSSKQQQILITFDDNEQVSDEETSDRAVISIIESLCEHSLDLVDALNRILNDLDDFPIGIIERTLNDFKQILGHCHFEQFTKIAELTTTQIDQKITQRICNSIKLLSEESKTTDEKEISLEISADFDFLTYSSKPLYKVTSLIRKWIPRLCDHLQTPFEKKGFMRQMKLAKYGNYISKFKSSMAYIDVFDGHFGPGLGTIQYNTQISHFMPIYEEYIQNDSICRLIRIRSLNGKIYSYQLERGRYEQASNRSNIFQLFTLLNSEFVKSRNTAQKHIQFAIPKILFTGSNSRMLECCPLAGISSQFQNANSDYSSENFVIFTDILGEMFNKEKIDSLGSLPRLSPLEIVEYYYKRLAEQRYSHKTIHELFNQISGVSEKVTNSVNQNFTVQRDLLSRWMNTRYPDSISFWIAKKKLCLHFALLGLTEHTFFLSPMIPDGLILDLSTAQLFFTEYKFDLTKKTCDSLGRKVQFIELDANRPVPFRLTSNISYFLEASIEGHFTAALTAIARCFGTRSLEVWLRPILWDMFSKAAEVNTKMNILNPVKRAVDTVLNRIKLISHLENGVGATNQLLMQAQLSDNLCRMDPGYHPWF